MTDPLIDPTTKPPLSTIDPRFAHLRGSFDAVVVGTSAGGVLALKEILPTLPATFSLPLVIVLHLPPDKKSLLPGMFASWCEIAVREVEDHEAISAGIYFAPPGYHVVVDNKHRLGLTLDEPVNWSRPSIDVLFESAATVFGARLLCVLLTGASSDGASGCETVRAYGGCVVVQTPATAASDAMPLSALARLVPDHTLDLADIAALMSAAGAPAPGA
ncbi:MAG TPA: chemotaxis protein CheB [Myxococcota bacterium]